MSGPDAKAMQDEIRSGMPSGSVEGAHVAFWKAIFDAIREQVQEYGITFGTVVGQDGGSLRTLLDGEDDPRQVGFPRAVGQQYARGARVAVGTTRDGAKFVLGQVSDGKGKQAEGVVNRDNIQDGEVQRSHLGNKSVGNDQIDGNAVDSAQIRPNAVGNSQLAPNSVDNAQLRANCVDSAQIKPNAVGNSQLAANSVDSAQIRNGAVDHSQLANNAVDSNNIKSGAVGSSQLASNALNAYAKVNDVNSKVIAKLDGKKLKVDKDGNVTLPSLSNL